ncbi:MAG: hypothetical protein R3247_04410 [Rhodothermales bacterium]|nr:hypothetical protein [Rhodothermales bacterium]
MPVRRSHGHVTEIERADALPPSRRSGAELLQPAQKNATTIRYSLPEAMPVRLHLDFRTYTRTLVRVEK